jgi:carbohydrate-selective porin OprB
MPPNRYALRSIRSPAQNSPNRTTLSANTSVYVPKWLATRPDTDRGIDLRAGADWTPPDRTRNNQDLTVGVRLNEPLPGRLHNTLGIAYVRSGINQAFPVSSVLTSTHAAEQAFEANVLLELPRGLVLQPVLQYYVNCGGSSHDAVVLGFHTKIDF